MNKKIENLDLNKIEFSELDIEQIMKLMKFSVDNRENWIEENKRREKFGIKPLEYKSLMEEFKTYPKKKSIFEEEYIRVK